jgi:transcriptional regulator GlxA family with amidase domain
MTRTVAFLIFPDFQLLDAAGPIGAFEMPTRMVRPAPYRLQVVAAAPGPVASSAGVSMSAEPFPPPDRIDTLIVVGGWGTRQAMRDEATLAFVRETARSARRVCSVCSGAFILAAAGLLDGKQATTHWGRGKELARLYPKVKVEADRIFVRAGAIWTSAGITAGIDLSLALIAEDCGESVARRAAQELVVYHRRPGGQSQFSALLELERPDGRFERLLSWARENLAESLGVEQLAGRAGMSPRNFTRVFTTEIGMTPAKAVEKLRLEAARLRVEAGEEPVDRIAALTGFGDPERMRRAFVRAFGQPPQALRRAARAVA